MNFAQGLSLALLGVCLIVAVWRRINIGVLALASAVIILLASGVSVDKMYTTFPGNLFTLIAGVSLLFAHLEKSGALRAFVDATFRTVGDGTYLLPWACFLIAGALSSMGAFSTAPIALMVPVVAFVSVKYPRSFFINELGVVIGANSAGLSPLNPTGATLHHALSEINVAYNTWGVWAISVATGAVAVAALQAIEAIRRRRGASFIAPAIPKDASSPDAPQAGNRTYAIASGCMLGLFMIVVVVFKFDIGTTSMLAALLLQIVFKPSERELIARVPWNAILLLCGLLTYLGLIKQIGTMDVIQQVLSGITIPALLVLMLAYITALLCNIESSTIGVLTLMAPIVGSALGASPSIMLIVAAVAAPAALTVMNPVHVAGTLIVANTMEDQQSQAFGRLFAIAVGCSVIAPGILSAIAIATL